MSAPTGCTDKITWGVVFRLLMLPLMTTSWGPMLILLLPILGHVEGEPPTTGVAADDDWWGPKVDFRLLVALVRMLTPEGICSVCDCCWWENYISHFLLLDLEKVKDILQTYLPVSSLGKHTIYLFILSTRNIHCLMSMRDTKMIFLLKVTLVEPVVVLPRDCCVRRKYVISISHSCSRFNYLHMIQAA